MEYGLNDQLLQTWSDERLEAYTIYLEQQLGKHGVFLAQVRSEWDRRYPSN